MDRSGLVIDNHLGTLVVDRSDIGDDRSIPTHAIGPWVFDQPGFVFAANKGFCLTGFYMINKGRSIGTEFRWPANLVVGRVLVPIEDNALFLVLGCDLV